MCIRVRAELVRSRQGGALLNTLMLIVAASIALSAATFLTMMEERAAAAEAKRSLLSDGADAVAAEMEEVLLVRVQALSGDLDDADLATLNSETSTLRVPAGMTLDHASTGYRVIEVRDREILPHDEVPVAAWTDQPRLSYGGTPPVGGLASARTLVIAVYATVAGTNGGKFRVRRDLAVSRIPPHQHALYAAGDTELCASESPNSWISGSVRVDGVLVALACGQVLRYTGGIEARDAIEVHQPSAHYVVGRDGQAALASVPRTDAASALAAALARWGGRVRVTSSLLGPVGPSRLNSASIAGVGECDDVVAAGALTCSGAARYYPSIQIQRTTPLAGPEYSVVCGAGYATGGCIGATAAITYAPWPFTGAQPPGSAAVDPSAAPYPWHGLLPDARRETRCTAIVAGHSYRTARCPTNVYGFTIDLAALPPVQGGLLSVRRATNQVPGANPSGAQEIVLLANATALAGPLTIHSEVPVYIVGSFNTAFRSPFNGPPPASIHAPRVVVLPNETVAQLRTTAVWDSVARNGAVAPSAEPLRAESNVTIYAVIRTQYCRSVDGLYFGGAWEGSPAVLGDWSHAGLQIVGSVEARDATTSAAACAAWAAPMGSPSPSGTATTQPTSRTLLADDRLLHPSFQPPGSWYWSNVPPVGPSAVPGRTSERQRRALGGTVVVRRAWDTTRGFPAVPGAVAIPPLPALPAAALPLP